MASKEHEIAVLAGLIAATLESAIAYDEARKHTQAAHVRLLFARRAVERKHVAAELRAQAGRLLGAEPVCTGAVAEAALLPYRVLTEAARLDDRRLASTLEAGEENLAHLYRAALADAALSESLRHLAHRAYDLIKTGHDEMRNLRHLVQAAS